MRSFSEMLRKKLLRLLTTMFLTVLITVCAAAQESVAEATQLPLATEVTRGSIEAILEAGSNGDKRYFPVLKSIVGRELPTLHSASGAAQMAMAKLGDEEQMKTIICELSYMEPAVQDEAIEKLKYVGGYGSIRVLASLLTEDHRNNELRWDKRPLNLKPGEKLIGQALSSPLSTLAMEALTAMVGGPKLPPPGDHIEQMFRSPKDREAWRDWLSQNDAQLRTREPQYANLEIRSDECRRQEDQENKALKKKRAKDPKATP